MASGGKAINLGELAIAIALKTGALEAGLKDVQNKLKDHGKKVQATGADYDKLAIVAGISFYKITTAISSGIKAFNDYNNSMVGLKSVVQGTGNSFSKAQQFVDLFTSDGLVPAADAAAGLKNLLSHGMGFDQAVDVMNRFKDSASFARQGSLTLGEAIRGGTEGLKNSLSMMVDNTGVTENLSVMWDKYAKTIGKTGATLSDAEKVQAEYVGIMRATAFQVGDAAKYSEQFAGAQARNSAETLKLKQAFGESLVPALNALLSVITPIISGLTSLLKGNEELVAGITTSTVVFLGFITLFTTIASAIAVLRPALTALNISFSGLLLNPVVLALVALVGVVTAVGIAISKAKREQDNYNAALEEHNKIVSKGISRSEVASLTEKTAALKKLSQEYDSLTIKAKELSTAQTTLMLILASNPLTKILIPTTEAGKQLIQLNDLNAQMKELGSSYKTVKDDINDYEKAIKEANKETAEEINSSAKTLAQQRATYAQQQLLIDQYNRAKKGTSEYRQAEKELADLYPQFATASGIQIDAIQNIVTTQINAKDAEWKVLQAKMAMRKQDLLDLIEIEQKKIAVVQAGLDAVIRANEGVVDSARKSAKLSLISESNQKMEQLKQQVKLYDDLSKVDLTKIAGVTPLDISGDLTGLETYENKALDSAMKIHDHKVAMEQLTKEQELKDLQTILKAYAKTADERMTLEEKIFTVKQAIRDRDLAATQKAIDDEAKKLAERTANSTSWIDREKSTGNLSGQEEIDAYNRIIKYHKEYLEKIKADNKISAEDKKKIIADETKTIQDQQNKIYDIQKANVEKAVNAYIDAKKKQYDTEERLENDRLNNKLKALDKEYSDKENALKTANRNADLNSLYDQERKYENAATEEGKDKLADIRRQIADLQTEAAKDQLEAEKENRRTAIEQEITDNQVKYKKLNEDLDTEGAAMIAATASYAKLANDEIVKGQSAIANSLKGIMTNFDKETSTLITTGMNNLTKLINGYKTIMDKISLKPNVQLNATATGGGNIGTVGKAASVVINDYGSKILNGIDDIQDYGKELVTGAENASRG